MFVEREKLKGIGVRCKARDGRGERGKSRDFK